MKLARDLLISLFLLASTALAETQSPPLPGSYTTTWLGNSIIDGRSHVPQAFDGLFVLPDGRVLTNTPWDEGDAEVTEFDTDGKIINVAAHTHGWGYDGGSCITANKQYVFFGERVENEGSHLIEPQTWPPKGKYWYGVSRRLLSDIQRGTSFAGGKGNSGDTLKSAFLVVGEVPPAKDEIDQTRDAASSPVARITAIAASETRLFVADPARSRICVYDAQTMALITELSNWPRVSALALDPDGNLWIAQTNGGNGQATITNLDPSLSPGPAKITLAENVKPAGIAIDPAGRVVVADGGPASKILTFDPHHLYGEPTKASSTFGVSLFSGNGRSVGQIAPGRFSDLTGVGIDQNGNLYLSSSTTGAVLEKYDNNGRRLWVRYALTFVDNSSVDPLTGDFYSSDEHYHFDWTKTAPGSEWSYVGKTLDRWRYPDDVRVFHEHAPLMRRLNGGRLYAYTVDQMASGIYIFRFDPASSGEIAIPCGCITKGRLRTYPALPAGQFIWSDANGDGRFDASEISQPPGPPVDLGDDCWGWWVDDNGDIWQTVDGTGPGRGLRHFKLQGFDSRGTPKYSYDAMEVTAIPAPFLDRGNDGLERVIYDSKSDAMYLGGYTEDAQNDRMWGSFRVLARYDHWSTGNRTPTWVTKLPWHQNEPGHENEVPISVAQAGDYLFVVGVKSLCRVSIYRAADGTYIGAMIPNNGIFSLDQTGWVDMRPFGVQANQRPDGTYAVSVEEDAYAKTVIYRWKP